MHSGFPPSLTDVVDLGRDGPVTLLRARDAANGRPVGLELIAASEPYRSNLERDLAALRPLSAHPNLVTVERVEPNPDGRLALVVEPTRGSLADRLRAGPLPVAEALAVTIRLAGALETLHRAGRVHGEVGAANVRMTERGEPALSAVGLTGLRRQPPASSAPERRDGAGTSAAADVYELAATTHQMVTGRPPGDTPAALPVELAPPDLSSALARALAHDPAARPTAADLAAQLERVQAGHGWARTPAVIGGDARASTPPAGDEWSSPTMTTHASGSDTSHDAEPSRDERLPEPPPPADATVVRRGRHAAADDEGPVGEIPVPPPPAEQTVRRPNLPPAPPPSTPPAEQTARRSNLPVNPPAAEQTVRRSTLPPAPPSSAPPSSAPPSSAPPSAGPPAAEQTVRRGTLPVPPPSGNETVRRSDLPGNLPTAPASQPSGVPTWATRTPADADASSAMIGSGLDLTLDPMSLSQRVTIRSGASALVVDDRRILMRSWFKRSELLWRDVLGFEPRFEGVGASGSGGRLVAITRNGPVELPATKRSLADLRYVQALLEAYRRRAQLTGPPP